MSYINKFEDNLNVVGKQVRKYRKERKLTYELLSTKLQLLGICVHKQSVYDIEHNKRTVKDYELYALAKVLGVDVNDLLSSFKEQLK